MSQNISSRKQELLSRLKTTLAIVSQATGFDSDRSNGDVRPVEPHQWGSVRDPRLSRRQEAGQEAASISDSVPQRPTSKDVSGSSAASSSVYHKVDEIQDEDEFLYGSSSSAPSSRAPPSEVYTTSGRDERSEERELGRLQWVTPRQVQQEEDLRWAPQPARQQPSYSDSSWITSSSDAQWMGSTEQASMARTSDPSQWVRPRSPKQDFRQWGAASQAVSRSSDLADNRQMTMQGSQPASTTTRVQPEATASKLQGINSDMLEGILKLVASGSSTSAAPPLQQQQQQQSLQYQQQPQQQYHQQQQHVQNWNQPVGAYPPQYNIQYPPQYPPQQPEPQVAMSYSNMPPTVSSHTSHLQQGMYHLSHPPAREQPVPQPQPSREVGPLFTQLAAAVLDSNLAQTSSQPLAPATDHMQRLSGLLEQAAGRNTAVAPRPAAAGIDASYVPSQQSVPAVGSVGQPSMTTNTWGSLQPTPPVAKSDARTPGMFPAATEAARYDVTGSSADASRTEKQTSAETDKGEPDRQKGDIDKGMLSQLLNMIGCSSNVTQLMKELIKKEEQDKTKKQQTVADSGVPQAPAAPVPASSSIAAAEPPAQLQVSTTDAKAVTIVGPHTPPEPAPSTANDDKPELTAADDSHRPIAPLTSEPKTQEVKPTFTPLATMPKTKDIKSKLVPLSSLSRLQKNYDSDGENGDRGSPSAAKTSSQPAKDDEWERSTEEFLRRLQSKPGAAAKSQKETSRSASHDRDKPRPKVVEGKKGASQQSKTEATKAQGKQEVRSEPTELVTDSEREELLRGKKEIEGALDLLQKELQNLRTNKKRLLDSPSDPQRDEELNKSIIMERELTDHISQLKNAMAELNQHLEKQSPAKPSDKDRQRRGESGSKERRGSRKRSRSRSRSASKSSRSSSTGSSSTTHSCDASQSRSSQRRLHRSRSRSRGRRRDDDRRADSRQDYERDRRPSNKERPRSRDRKPTEAAKTDAKPSPQTASASADPEKRPGKPPAQQEMKAAKLNTGTAVASSPGEVLRSSAAPMMNPINTSAVAAGSAGTPQPHIMKTSPAASAAGSETSTTSTFSRDNIVRNLQEMVKPAVTVPEPPSVPEDIVLNEKQKSALELAISMYMAANEFYDGGGLWCRPCNSIFADISALCRHIHSDQHQLKLDPNYDKPKPSAVSKKPRCAEGSVVVPARGDEFLMPLQAFFCSLCCEFSKDSVSAEAHIKSREHNNKFKNFLKDNPSYEMQYLSGKMNAVTSAAHREVEARQLQLSREMANKQQQVFADMQKRKSIETQEEAEVKRIKINLSDAKQQMDSIADDMVKRTSLGIEKQICGVTVNAPEDKKGGEFGGDLKRTIINKPLSESKSGKILSSKTATEPASKKSVSSDSGSQSKQEKRCRWDSPPVERDRERRFEDDKSSRRKQSPSRSARTPPRNFRTSSPPSRNTGRRIWSLKDDKNDSYGRSTSRRSFMSSKSNDPDVIIVEETKPKKAGVEYGSKSATAASVSKSPVAKVTSSTTTAMTSTAEASTTSGLAFKFNWMAKSAKPTLPKPGVQRGPMPGHKPAASKGGAEVDVKFGDFEVLDECEGT